VIKAEEVTGFNWRVDMKESADSCNYQEDREDDNNSEARLILGE
jgi:hypothetical protein